MAANSRLAGTAYLAIDGKNVALVGDFEWDSGLVVRETLQGMDGIHGFKEKPKAGRISGMIRDLGGVSVSALNNLVNVTVTCELANGKRVTGRNMWQVGELVAKAEDATFELKFEGVAGCVSETLSK
jgi:Phage tail tube protein